MFVVLAINLTNVDGTLSFTRYDYPGSDLGTIGWSVLAVFLILAATNSVNLTDGLDGLAAGSSIFAFAAFVVICFVGFRHIDIYGDQSFLDTAVIAAAMLGGCAGFLWWNAAPAQIFMGDTGAFAIGAALGDPRPQHEHGAAPADHRGLVRDGDVVGHHPSRQLPDDGQAGVPHGAVPPSLRAGWLARDHGHRPAVDRRRSVHRARARVVLRRLLAHTWGHRMTAPQRTLVYGFATTGQSVARALRRRGLAVVVADDHPSPMRAAQQN